MCIVCTSGPARAEEAPSVALDMSGLGEQAFKELDGLALEKSTLVRLVQEGFAVVAPSAGADVVLRMSRSPAGLVIEAARGERRISTEVTVAPAARLPELHLEIAQKTVELARQALATGVEPESEPVAVPESQPVAVPVPVPVPESQPVAVPLPREGVAIELQAAAGGGALWRAGGVDPILRVGVRLGIGARWGARVEAAMVPSSATGMDIVEWQVQAGAGYRVPLAARVVLEGGLLVGVLVHDFSLDDRAAVEPSGSRTDWVASLPLALELRPSRMTALSASLAPGLSGRERSHSRDGVTTWERGAARLEAGLALAVRW